MAISFSLARPHAKTSSIRVKVAVDGAYLFLYTGRSIETCHWDKRKCFIKSYAGKSPTSRLVRYLKKLEMGILDQLDEYRNGNPRLTFLELQERLNRLLDNRRTKFNRIQNTAVALNESLVDFSKRFIKDCELGVRLSPKRQRIKPKSMHTYYTTLSYLVKFQQQVNRTLLLTEFNQVDIDQLSDYLIIERELAMNSHAKIMMDLLQIIKYAIQLKKIPPSRQIELKLKMTLSVFVGQIR
jgi:hypothetical protein